MTFDEAKRICEKAFEQARQGGARESEARRRVVRASLRDRQLKQALAIVIQRNEGNRDE